MILMERDLPLFPLERYSRAIDPILHQCFDNHQWNATPHNILAGKGCPYCAGNRKYTTKEYQAQLADIIVVEDYVDNVTKILHECLVGHRWYASPSNIKSGYGCPQCWSTKRTKSSDAYIKELKAIASELIPTVPYLKANIKINHRCEKGHEYLVEPHKVLERPWCTQCNGKDRSHIVYYIKINNLYKIGITFREIEDRFKADKDKRILILKTWKFPDFHKAKQFESIVLTEFKDHRQPNTGYLKSRGDTETFSWDILQLDTMLPLPLLV